VGVARVCGDGFRSFDVAAFAQAFTNGFIRISGGRGTEQALDREDAVAPVGIVAEDREQSPHGVRTRQTRHFPNGIAALFPLLHGGFPGGRGGTSLSQSRRRASTGLHWVARVGFAGGRNRVKQIASLRVDRVLQPPPAMMPRPCGAALTHDAVAGSLAAAVPRARQPSVTGDRHDDERRDEQQTEHNVLTRCRGLQRLLRCGAVRVFPGS